MKWCILLGVAVAIWLIGYFSYLQEEKEIMRVQNDLVSYHERFIEFINKLFNKRIFDSACYAYCMENVTRIQNELGADGLIELMQDPLKGIQVRNYQLLPNALMEFREMSNSILQSNTIFIERMNQLVGYCDDAFHRKLGNLNDLNIRKEQERKNPIRCLCYGVKALISFPTKILFWCGIISHSVHISIENSRVMKLLSGIVTLLGIASAIITIVVGWKEFLTIVSSIVGFM